MKFNGVTANVTSASPTRIVTTVPTGATTGAVTVTTPSGSDTSDRSFVVRDSDAPSISSFTPTIASPDATVALSGTNFDPTVANDRVTFNGTLAHLDSASATSILTKATSGKVSITTPDGRATSSADFFVPPAPYTAADIDDTGRMAVGDTKTVSVSPSGHISLVLFDGKRGQRVSFGVSSNSIYIAYISVISPGGATLVSQTGLNSNGLVEPVTLPASGTYTVVVDPYSSYTGSLALKLYDVPDHTSGIINPGGDPVTITITTPGQNAKLTFQGTQGQRISMQPSSSSIPGTVYEYVNKPDGSRLTYTSNTSFLDTVTLPATGTYSLVVDPSGASTGSITLKLYDVPAGQPEDI